MKLLWQWMQQTFCWRFESFCSYQDHRLDCMVQGGLRTSNMVASKKRKSFNAKKRGSRCKYQSTCRLTPARASCVIIVFTFMWGPILMLFHQLWHYSAKLNKDGGQKCRVSLLVSYISFFRTFSFCIWVLFWTFCWIVWQEISRSKIHLWKVILMNRWAESTIMFQNTLGFLLYLELVPTQNQFLKPNPRCDARQHWPKCFNTLASN